jgi:hypothetical protein
MDNFAFTARDTNLSPSLDKPYKVPFINQASETGSGGLWTTPKVGMTDLQTG